MSVNGEKGRLDIVVGGQFGSEGKGAIGAWLAKNVNTAAAVRVAGPNAGHSAVDAEGRKWALRQIPVAAVVDHELLIVLGAGSEIDEAVLLHEITELEKGGIPVRDRLCIDSSATVITPDHIAQEAQGGINGRLGSTAKGIGAARADRIWRQATVWGSDRYLRDDDSPGIVEVGGIDTAALLRNTLRRGGNVMLEGTQGYGLGLHTEYYPQCTSSDCRAVDFAAMAGITPWADAGQVNTWVVLRTFPIRVAGNSGPLRNETSWDALANRTGGYIRPEKTTVTQKTRRVGGWDSTLARAAIEANGGGDNVRIALTFFDYWFPALAGATSADALGPVHRNEIYSLQNELDAEISVLGTGPDTAIVLKEA